MDTIHAIKSANLTKTELQNLTQGKISKILSEYSQLLVKNIEKILIENVKDLNKMDKNDSKYDRLLLNEDRIKSIAADVLKISDYKFDPFKTISETIGQNGIQIKKSATPFGVIGIIFESRPNVTVDAISICLKTQNVCILKGSAEAEFSNAILTNLAKQVLVENNINQDIITLLKATRDAALGLISARGIVDLIIPRGGSGLINFVRENAKVSIIETGAGVVHAFINEDCDIEIAQNIIFNSKTRRPSVCNSLDCILVSENQLPNLADILTSIIDFGVEIFADERSYLALEKIGYSGLKKADENSFGHEFLSLKISTKTVKDIDEAIEFINQNSSKHSEIIITKDEKNAEKFLKNIDAAVVYHNTSSSFTDGGCFGMISEIGISTQKLHARGPFSLDELLTYKYVVKSDGQTR